MKIFRYIFVEVPGPIAPLPDGVDFMESQGKCWAVTTLTDVPLQVLALAKSIFAVTDQIGNAPTGYGDDGDAWFACNGSWLVVAAQNAVEASGFLGFLQRKGWMVQLELTTFEHSSTPIVASRRDQWSAIVGLLHALDGESGYESKQAPVA